MLLERLRRIIKNCQTKILLKITIVFNPEKRIQLAEHTAMEDTFTEAGCTWIGGGRTESQNTLFERMDPKLNI